MSSFSIAPAAALMLPAAGPFFLVLVALFLVGRFPSVRPDRRVFLADLSVLSGILLVFGVFDSPSLRHFLHPEQPLDWIPLLASATFSVRNLFSRLPSPVIEAVMTLTGLLILLMPLLRQGELPGGAREVALIYAAWMAIRLLYPVGNISGDDRMFLIPLLLATGALSLISPLSGSLLLGQLAGGMAAVTGAMVLAALTGTVPFTAIEAGWVLGALLLVGWQYVDIAGIVVGSLAGSLFLGAVSARLVRKIPGRFLWGRYALVIACTLALLIIGVARTLKTLKDQGGGY